MSETMKVFWSCAIGALIGTLVSLEVNHYFWWLGLLVGGLTGYLSYEWRTVLHAIPAAYRAARGWQLPPLYLITVGWVTLVAASYTFYGLLFFSSIISSIIVISRIPLPLLLSWSILTILLTAVFASMLYKRPDTVSAEKEMEWRRLCLCEIRNLAFWFAPPLVFFWHLPRGIKWVARRIPLAVVIAAMGIAHRTTSFARFLHRFGWQLSLQIHSEIRILCGLDAAIGAAIGYFTGSAIIGAIAGGLWGVLNFEILSIRVLKLVPIEKSLFR